MLYKKGEGTGAVVSFVRAKVGVKVVCLFLVASPCKGGAWAGFNDSTIVCVMETIVRLFLAAVLFMAAAVMMALGFCGLVQVRFDQGWDLLVGLAVAAVCLPLGVWSLLAMGRTVKSVFLLSREWIRRRVEVGR